MLKGCVIIRKINLKILLDSKIIKPEIKINLAGQFFLFGVRL